MSTQGKLRRNSIQNPPDLSDVNIMLLGLTGSGKSASGNTILGGDRKPFKEGFSSKSVTRICESEHRQTIRVIDTVGLSDTTVKITDVQSQIVQMLQGTNLDVFLLVIKLGETFRKESSQVVKRIQDNFGAKVLKHTIVLFTHGDQLRVPIEDYLSKCEALRSVVDQCSGGFHVFNNKDKDRSQVTELLEKIESLRKNNQYRRYTEQDYKETQEGLPHRKGVTGVVGGGLAAVAVAGAGAAIAVVVLSGGAASGVGQAVPAKASMMGSSASTAGGLEGAASGVSRKLVEAAGAAVASMMGAAALTAEQAALGAAGVVLVAAVGAGVYFLNRKYNSKEKERKKKRKKRKKKSD